MKAVQAHERGGPQQLVVEVVPRPEPGPGESLIAVHAASITKDELSWDATWTDSLNPGGRDRTPIIPAHEVSGVVARLGSGKSQLQEGDEVYGLIPFVRDGAAAEFVTVPVETLARKPLSVDHDTAAAIPLPGLTAWQGLVCHSRLEAGQHILIHGAAGGVGVFAVQIAAHLEAQITATARARDASFLKDLGVTTVVDYETERFEDLIHDADVVLDLVGGSTQSRSWGVLKRGGMLVSIVAPPDPREARNYGVRAAFFIVEPNRDQLTKMAAFVDQGQSVPSWTASDHSPTQGPPIPTFKPGVIEARSSYTSHSVQATVATRRCSSAANCVDETRSGPPDGQLRVIH